MTETKMFRHNGFEHDVDRQAQAVIDTHPGSTLTAAYRAVAVELFSIVSASPQPRCPKCRSERVTIAFGAHLEKDKKIFSSRCREEECQFRTEFSSEMAQFFTPAPAQEPPKGTCPCSKDHGPHEGKLINISWHGLDLTVCERHEPLYRPLPPIDAMAEYRAAQPVENSSRCPKCDQPTKPMYGDEPPSEWDHHCPAEPISGGASTGEQPPTWEQVLEKEPEPKPWTSLTERLCPCDRVDCMFCGPRIANRVMNLAARPSEPSAPKVEPPAYLEQCSKEGPGCDCVGVCKFRPAQATETASAPQEHNCPECGRWHSILRAIKPAAAPSVAGTQPTPTAEEVCKALWSGGYGKSTELIVARVLEYLRGKS